MAVFINKKEREYELINEGSERVLRIDYTKKTIIPSIEDSEECMQDVINKLVENAGVSRIVLVQQRNYNYNYSQVQLLVEIARSYNHQIFIFLKQVLLQRKALPLASRPFNQ